MRCCPLWLTSPLSSIRAPANKPNPRYHHHHPSTPPLKPHHTPFQFPLKRGEHRAYVAVHGGGGRRCVSLTLSKGARSRVGEDDLVSRLLVKVRVGGEGRGFTFMIN